MAFPSIRSSATTNGTTATASPVVNLPATIAAGDTLIVYFKNAVAGAIGFPAGWVELVDASPDASVGQIGIAYKKAVGGEGGTTITLSSGNGKFAAVARAIADATDPTIRAPEISTVAVGTTGEPNATTVTPTGGAKDYLWDTVFLMEGEQTGITANPANYSTSQQFANSGVAGAVTTNCTIGAVARTNNAASEDAGVWDVAGVLDDSSAYTLAFHPAEAIAQPLAPDGEFPFPLPAPRRSAPLVALTIAVNLLQSTLAPPPDTLPFRQEHWPTPSRRPVLITTVNSYPADDAAIAFKQTDWPNPRGRGAPPPTWLQNLLESTLAPQEAAPPFAPIAWPNPSRGSARDVGFVASTLNVTTLAEPFAQHEWPLPERLRVSPHTWTQNLQQSTLAAAEPTPFATTEWPNPRLATRSALTWTQERKPYYVDERLLRQDAWPNPTRRPATLPLTWTQNLLQSTLAPAPDVKPFAQNDWPLPLRGPVPRLTWTQDRKTYYQDAQIPREAFAWTVPRRAPATALTWSQNLLESTLAPGAPTPFVPIAWPLPLRAARVPVSITGSVLPLPLAGPVPFQPIDWPNPRGREYPISLRTWTNERKPHHVDLKPFSQTEWPNPLPRKVASDLVLWTRAALTDGGFTVLLLEITDEVLRSAGAASEQLHTAATDAEALRRANTVNESLEPW